MKMTLTAITLAAALAQPAAAVTFPTLTTIYVGSGAAGETNLTATTVDCTNVSGVTVNVRFLFLGAGGAVAGARTATVVHGQTYTVSTQDTQVFVENFLFQPPLSLTQGAINVEANNSGVFCTAKVVEPDVLTPNAYTLPLVRVNPHPGTVE
jgi:hypothetical protein